MVLSLLISIDMCRDGDAEQPSHSVSASPTNRHADNRLLNILCRRHQGIRNGETRHRHAAALRREFPPRPPNTKLRVTDDRPRVCVDGIGASMRQPTPHAIPLLHDDDLRKGLSAKQLRSIGAIAVAWNELERMLDCLLYSGLDLAGCSCLDVLAHLSTDARVDLIASAEENLRLPAQWRSAIAPSVKSTKELNRLHSSVVHARVFDARMGIGVNTKRGERISTFMFVVPALECLYERFVVLHGELRSVLALFNQVRIGKVAAEGGSVTDEAASGDGQASDHLRQLRLLQSQQSMLAKNMEQFLNTRGPSAE
jgi:hypothetical protein